MVLGSNISDIDGGPCELAPSLFHVMEKTALQHPDEVAMIVTTQETSHLAPLTGKQQRPEEPCLTWTFGELHHASIQVVNLLQSRYSVKPGSTIVSLIPNGIEYPLALWFSMLGKYTYCPLDANLLANSNTDELKRLLTKLEADVVLVADGEAASLVDTQLTYRPKAKIVASNDRSDSWADLSSFAIPFVNSETRAAIEDKARTDDLDRTSLVLFTSGTSTGVPKGCPRPVAAWILASAVQYMGMKLEKPRRSFHTQNFRVIAPVITWRTWSESGAMVMIGNGFDPSAMIDAIETHELTQILMLPAMLAKLQKEPRFDQIDKSSLKTIVLGGDMITEDAYNKTCAAFPGTEVFNAHGMTEGGFFFQWPYEGKTGPQDVPTHGGILPLGRVNPGTRLLIVDDDNRPVEIGTKGNLHLQNRGCVRRYLDNVKPEDFYSDERGEWFKTGDTGIMNSEGWVWVLGREKDVIKRAAVSLSPATIESCIDTYLKTQSSVFGVPHPEYGQEPVAVVRDLNGRSKEDTLKHVLERFGNDSELGGLVTLKELGLEEFPVNGTGKIMKLDLQPAVAELAGTR